MVLHLSSNTKDLAFFDVRLRTGGFHNTVLVKGNENEVDYITIEGHVKLLTQEDLHVKRVRLQLVGEFVCDYYDRNPYGHMVGQVYERDCAVKVVWPNLLTTPKGDIVFGNYGDKLMKVSKADHLRKLRNSSSLNLAESFATPVRPDYVRTASQPSLARQHEESLFTIPRSGIDGTPYPLRTPSDNHSFLLPQGNYSLPFLVRLPSDVPESVEGLANSKMLYKLECTVERGRFDRSFHTGKHIRIVRTLHPRSMNLVDLIDFGNTWPGKVEFNVSIPKKGLAMGTSVPIKLIAVPLVKGLKFKSIHAEIVQHHHLCGLGGNSPEFENLVGRQKLSCDTSCSDEDHWVVQAVYKVPSTLQELSQSCTLKNDMVNVKHRLRVTIHIGNADGHVSEVRANLPVHVFMSPHHGKITAPHWVVDKGNFEKTGQEDTIFHCESRNETPNDSGDEADYDDERETDAAPPVYQNHSNDMIYDQTSPRTPMEQLRIHGIRVALDSYFNFPSDGPGTRTPPVDLNTLLKVPSYEQAIDDDSDDDGDEPAPLYASSTANESAVSSLSSSPAPFSGLLERSASMSNLVLNKERSSGNRVFFLRRENDRS